MGISVFPAPTGGLPAGATERVASGFARDGYAAITGTFSAGKYLVVSNVASSVNFTTGQSVKGYQNACFKNGETYVVNLPVTSTVLEYQSILDITTLNAQAGNQGSSSTDTAYRWNANTRSVPLAPRSLSAAWTHAHIPYKGQHYGISATAGTLQSLTSATSYQSVVGIGTTNLTSWSSDREYPGASNGTRYVGIYNTATPAIFYTDNPASTTGWVSVSANIPANPVGVYYGGDKYICISNSTAAAWSNDGATWTSFSLPATPGNWYGSLAYGNGIWVLMPIYGTNSQTYYTSVNGTTWTTRTFGRVLNDGASNGGWAVNFLNGRFVCVSSSPSTSYTNPDVFGSQWSVDGINWMRVRNPMSRFSAATTWQWRASDNGAIMLFSNDNGPSGMFTVDGVNWLGVTAEYPNSWFLRGTRGFGLTPASTGVSLASYQPNAYFDIYRLNSNYTDYTSY